MKIGILTFPNSPSHGCSLQMFALYTELKKLGADAEIILYSPDGLIHNRIKPLTAKQKLQARIAKAFLKNSRPSFARFEAQLTRFPHEVVKTDEEMEALAARYDRIVVGSDQVWNPVVTGGDLNYYLKFSPDFARNASYAPSFGIDEVVEDKEEITRLLKNIKYLSAREVQGQKIIKSLTGRDVPLVLDPTMLLEQKDWKGQELVTNPCKKPYVLYYTIKPSSRLREYAQRFAEANGCALVTIGGRLREHFDPRKHCVFGAGPGEFLNLVSKAEVVITNSFHGTVFSILYHKKFKVEYSSDTNSRLTNLIDTFGLGAQVADAGDTAYQVSTPDYARVDAVLEEKRTASVEYLKSIIEG